MKIFILSFVLICASSFSSAHEIKELKEEGVKTEIIPWFEDKSN